MKGALSKVRGAPNNLSLGRLHYGQRVLTNIGPLLAHNQNNYDLHPFSIKGC